MEYIIIIILCTIILITLKFIWNIKLKNLKKIKEIGYDERLNEITNKLPENKEICKTILKMLDNENVQIKENNNESSFYFVLSNSILIANIKNTFTRLQTISHECLHSIQNRKTLLFNFFFSNIYILYFILICIITVIKFNFHHMIYMLILIGFSFVYYAVRSSLEMDAMIKAKELSKEYMIKESKLSCEEQNEILKNYEIINEIGIPLTNFKLIFDCILKIIIYCILCIIF